jgi:hypothetical protein
MGIRAAYRCKTGRACGWGRARSGLRLPDNNSNETTNEAQTCHGRRKRSKAGDEITVRHLNKF